LDSKKCPVENGGDTRIFMRHKLDSLMQYSEYVTVMHWLRSLGRSKILVVFMIFLPLNAVLYCFSPTDSFLEPDTQTYLASAKSLIETGSFVSEWRLPGYPFFLAGVLAITDHVGAFAVVLQAVLLFMTGIVASKIAEIFVPKAGLPTLAFVCFNPSA